MTGSKLDSGMWTRRAILCSTGAVTCGLASASVGKLFRPDQGAPADDETDELQRLFDTAHRNGGTVELQPRTYNVGTLVLPSDLVLKANGAVLRALPEASRTCVVFIPSSRVRIEGSLTIELAGNARSAILIDNAQNISIDADVSVAGPARTGGDGFNGGVLIQQSAAIFIKAVNVEKVHQWAGHPGLYRALGVRFSRDISVARVTAVGCDIGAGLFSCDGCNLGALAANDLTDNGLYLNSDCHDIAIGRILLSNVEEGIVLNCRSPNTGLLIENAVIRHASNKGVSMRTGGGYTIKSLTCEDAIIADSSHYQGVSGLVIGDASLSTTRPSSLVFRANKSRNVQIARVTTPDDQVYDGLRRYVGKAGLTLRIGSLQKSGAPRRS